jgi:CspA family cold shock protein
VGIRIKKVNFKQNNMKQGVVKFFNEAKGFGFIKDNETGKEYFVHATGLIDQVKENDAVSFEVGEGKKGPIAVDVKLVRN